MHFQLRIFQLLVGVWGSNPSLRQGRSLLRVLTSNAFSLVCTHHKCILWLLVEWLFATRLGCKLYEGSNYLFFACLCLQHYHKHILHDTVQILEWMNESWVWKVSLFSYYVLSQEVHAPVIIHSFWPHVFRLDGILGFKKGNLCKSPLFFSGWSWMKLRVSISDTPTLMLLSILFSVDMYVDSSKLSFLT